MSFSRSYGCFGNDTSLFFEGFSDLPEDCINVIRFFSLLLAKLILYFYCYSSAITTSLLLLSPPLSFSTHIISFWQPLFSLARPLYKLNFFKPPVLQPIHYTMYSPTTTTSGDLGYEGFPVTLNYFTGLPDPSIIHSPTLVIIFKSLLKKTPSPMRDH